MRKFLIVIIVLLACSCAHTGGVPQDETPLTLLTSYGFGQEFTLRLAEQVKERYGIKLEFITEKSSDSATLMWQDLANDNMPADIILTAQQAPDSLLKGSCINLQARSNLTDLFPYLKVRECTADDGGVYQLPFCSKLIGITYNATLMEEMGCKAPRTYADMLELKKKCDEKGILFAATDMNLTGCGFNFLLHPMGSQWLSTLEGTEWINSFIKGEASISTFKEHCSYFRKWTENGLFGQPFAETGKAANVFKTRRALFLYSIFNNLSSYQGPECDENGVETGRILDDTYKTMPWISEDGSSNCFTNYDAIWVMLNHRLLKPDQQDKLEKALKVLRFIAEDNTQEIIANRGYDVYLYLEGFKSGEDRVYSNYTREISRGYIQPWYYNYFDGATIVNTGAEINSYLIKNYYGEDGAEAAEPSNMVYNPDASFDSIFEVFEHNNNNNNNLSQKHFLGTVKQTLSYQQSAQVYAVSCALCMQENLNKEYGKENAPAVEVAIIPYTKDLKDLDPWTPASVECAHIYPGHFEAPHTNVITPINAWRVSAFRMTGAEIGEIVRNGYLGYPYAVVTKGGIELQNDVEYIVTTSRKLLEDSVLEWIDSRVLLLPGEDKELTANGPHGVELFFALHPEVGPEDINW